MNFKKKLPMILTILRFILVIPFIYFLLLDKPVYLIISLIIYSLASITDWFDGFFARKFNAVSKIGAFLDPLADKILTLSAFIIFSLKDYVYLPFFFVILMILREYFVTMMRVEIEVFGKDGKGENKPINIKESNFNNENIYNDGIKEKNESKFVTSKEAKFKTAFQMITIAIFYLFYAINKNYIKVYFLTENMAFLSYIPLLLFTISLILAYYSSFKYIKNYLYYASEVLTKTISTFFYIGYFPFASGTFASFITLVLFLVIKPSFWILMIFILISLLLGTIFSTKHEKELMVKDPSIIVIDEVVGMMISLIPLTLINFFITRYFNDLSNHRINLENFIANRYFYILASFVLFIIFRFFDIVKPFFIKKVQKLKGGIGIMIDDIISSFLSVLSFCIICAIILMFIK